MGRRYINLERNQGSLIQGHYSCAICWTPVLVCHDKKGTYITCGDDICRCEGLIKTSSVEFYIQQSELLAREARDVLQVHFEWLRPKKRKRLTQEENLKELGF